MREILIIFIIIPGKTHSKFQNDTYELTEKIRPKLMMKNEMSENIAQG